jgi:hypothetical protein
VDIAQQPTKTIDAHQFADIGIMQVWHTASVVPIECLMFDAHEKIYAYKCPDFSFIHRSVPLPRLLRI